FPSCFSSSPAIYALPKREKKPGNDFRYLASGSPGTRLKIYVAIPRLLQSKLLRPVNSDSLSFCLGISEFTVIPTPPLVKVSSTKPANFLITYSGSNAVKHFRCGQCFIVETVHGEHSGF